MQETSILKQKSTTITEPPRIKKKIGKTTYEVSLHFNKNSTENVQDKLRRIILNDSNIMKNLPE